MTLEAPSAEAIAYAATITPSECSVFVQIWVDTNAVQTGSTTGIYLIDSNHNNGSSNEGSTQLNTNVPTNSKICWQVLPIDVNFTGELSIANFSNAAVFGASGTPKAVNATTWTGQVEDDGVDGYSITINIQSEGGSGITATVNPVLTVSNK